MNFVVPIILLLASAGLFFGYVDPNYKSPTPSDQTDYKTYSITALKQELANFNGVAQNSTDIIKKRDVLIADKNKISNDNNDRLEKLLPSNIDNIKLIIEIGKIAQGRGLTLRNVSVGNFNNSQQVGAGNSSYGTLSLSFTVTSSYNNFLSFLSDLENNLRIIDVTGINFTSSDNGQYDFGITLNTYWLK